MPKKIIIFRHGETNYNRRGISQGWLNNPLSAIGKSQAQKLAKRLNGLVVDSFYSSDLKRAQQTARIVAKAINFSFKKTKLLRERNQGFFTNRPFAYLEEKYPDLFQAMKDHTNVDWKEHGGESRSDVFNRVGKLLNRLHKHHPNQTVLISTHGGPKRELLRFMNLIETTDSQLQNTSLTIIEKDDQGKYQLTLFNDTKHLDE